MSFRSTIITLTGSNSPRILGEFALHGVNKPMALDAPNYKLDGAVKTGDFELPAPAESERGRRRNLT